MNEPQFDDPNKQSHWEAAKELYTLGKDVEEVSDHSYKTARSRLDMWWSQNIR